MLNNTLYSLDVEQIYHVIDTDHMSKKLFVENTTKGDYGFVELDKIEEEIRQKGKENLSFIKVAQIPMSLFDIEDYKKGE